MTALHHNSPSLPTSTSSASSASATFRQLLLLANVWLLFLVFPVISIVVDDLSTTRRTIAIGLIAVFAVTHVVAYRELIRRGLGLQPEGDVDRGALWFVALVALTVGVCWAGSWSGLSIVPFLVSFGIFHFSWRTALIIGATSLAAVVVAPALAGVLDQAWFFGVLVLSVGGAAGLNRADNEREEERGALLAQLAVSGERDRLARDVHDVLGHSLTVVILKAQVCDRLLQTFDEPDAVSSERHDAALSQTRAQLAELESVSRRALSEIRATVGGLRSADLADELAAARVVLADAEVSLTVVGDVGDVAASQRQLVGWVLREATTNIIRHARATQCKIYLGPEVGAPHQGALIRIVDNGVGMGDNEPGNGLTGLRERVEAAGATLLVASDGGTELQIVGPATDSTRLTG